MLGKGDFEKYTVNNVELEKTVLRFLFFLLLILVLIFIFNVNNGNVPVM